MSSAAVAARRSAWLKTLLSWHWISSALCLVGMLLFAITGITLNHAGSIEARPEVLRVEKEVPAQVADALRQTAEAEAGAGDDAALPAEALAWAREAFGVTLAGKPVEWDEREAYVALPRPGGDAWLRIDFDARVAEYELTDRGWIAYFNDLHKGRHTGTAWAWFLDIFAVACLVFSLTGLWILKMHASRRALTWPMVGAGLVVPALLALLFIH